MLAALDALIGDAPKRLTRPQAIRHLVEAGLQAAGKLPPATAPATADAGPTSLGQRLVEAAKQATAIVRGEGSEGAN